MPNDTLYRKKMEKGSMANFAKIVQEHFDNSVFMGNSVMVDTKLADGMDAAMLIPTPIQYQTVEQTEDTMGKIGEQLVFFEKISKRNDDTIVMAADKAMKQTALIQTEMKTFATLGTRLPTDAMKIIEILTKYDLI